jgi:hypothetical protein
MIVSMLIVSNGTEVSELRGKKQEEAEKSLLQAGA